MPLRAGNVGRVSHKDRKKKDPRDRARSVAEQHADNDAAIRANRHLEASRYEDEESASRFARKERVDWPRLVDDVERGNLDIVYLWEASRGSRKLSEWTDFLDLCREQGVLIHVTTHRHTYDMRVRRDRKTLIEEGVDAEDDSEKTSERTQRALATNAANGMPHGVRQYGFERTHDERTGALTGQRPLPGEAEIAAEIIRRIASAEPVSAITDDLNRRKIPAHGGNNGSGEWTRRTVRRLAASPAYIGKRRVGDELIDAQWNPIIGDDIFWAAQHVLSNPARHRTRPGKAKFLLSYLMICDVCGKPVQVNTLRCRMTTLKYWCSEHQGHSNRVNMEEADVFVTAAVKRRVARPDLYAHLVAGNDERIVQARAEAARLRAELDEWAEADISAHAYAIREGKLMPLIEAAEKRAAELAVPLALRELAAPGADVDARWDGMPVAARRDVIRLLFPKLKLLDGTGPASKRIVNE